jgi:protein TonB
MNITRLISAAIVASITTIALLFLMQQLISKEWVEPENLDSRKIADINLPDRKIETQYDTTKPDKPEEPQKQPDVVQPEFDTPDTTDSVNIPPPTLNSDISIAGIGGFKSDGEYLPIVKVQPRYPQRALSRGIEGYVIVEFTVTANGSVRDPVVVEADPQGMFDRAAMDAALKFKYKPRVIDGAAVEVPGVRNKISFALEKER